MTTTTALSYKPMRLTGRCANGAGFDSGYRYHAVPGSQQYSFDKALCGVEAGRLSSGWVNGAGSEITCPKCLKKIAKLAKA